MRGGHGEGKGRREEGRRRKKWSPLRLCLRHCRIMSAGRAGADACEAPRCGGQMEARRNGAENTAVEGYTHTHTHTHTRRAL